MSHGTFKPRNKNLNDQLHTRKSGPHEDKTGGNKSKRARVRELTERELRDEERSYAY